MAHLITTTVNRNDPAFLYLALHPEEDIRAIVRHHWAGFLGTIGLTLGMALIPVLLFVLVNGFFAKDIEQIRPVLLLLGSSFYLFLITFLFGAWINYYYDVIFITNERIINVAQEGLLAREVSELSLAQIEDVSVRVEGILQSAFNYGLLIIETAGEGTTEESRPGIHGYFTVSDIPDPNRVARLVIELHRQVNGPTP